MTRNALAIVLGVSVVVSFFCPLPQGSFQATHGPTTAFRSMRAALAVILAIAIAAAQPIILASLFLLLFLASLLCFQGDRDDLLATEDPVRVTCELRC